jgi:hypothetical protein
MSTFSSLVLFASAGVVSAGGGGLGGGPPSLLALTDFGSGGSPLATATYTSYGQGASAGAYSTGAFQPYSSGGFQGPSLPNFQGPSAYSTGGYNTGGFNLGGADASRYAALAVESSSSASTVGAYNTFAQAPRKHQFRGPPALGLKRGGKHGFKQQPEQVEVQQFVSNEAELVEDTVNAYARKKSYTVTHRPVYHKTTYNHYTATDNIAKDVYHHLYEDEVAHYEVDGEQFNAGALNVNHGKVDDVVSGYQALVSGQVDSGNYATKRTGPLNRAGLNSFSPPNFNQGGGFPVINSPPQALIEEPSFGGGSGYPAAGSASFPGSTSFPGSAGASFGGFP